jgi:hypothetical protein
MGVENDKDSKCGDEEKKGDWTMRDINEEMVRYRNDETMG